MPIYIARRLRVKCQEINATVASLLCFPQPYLNSPASASSFLRLKWCWDFCLFFSPGVFRSLLFTRVSIIVTDSILHSLYPLLVAPDSVHYVCIICLQLSFSFFALPNTNSSFIPNSPLRLITVCHPFLLQDEGMGYMDL